MTETCVSVVSVHAAVKASIAPQIGPTAPAPEVFAEIETARWPSVRHVAPGATTPAVADLQHKYWPGVAVCDRSSVFATNGGAGCIQSVNPESESIGSVLHEILSPAASWILRISGAIESSGSIAIMAFSV
jgi:hypothetical protein